MHDSRQIKAIRTLQWYHAIGVDEAIGAEIQDRTQKQAIQSAPPIEKKPNQMHAARIRNAGTGTAPAIGKLQATQDAQQQAAQATNLQELEQAIRAFEGNPLKFTATNCVFAEGNPASKIMFIGEGPGADEDLEGKPFVGLSGQFLNKMLSFIGLESRVDYYITNVVNWRPPGNREPTPEELAVSLPFIRRHIELVAPEIIILVGGVAAKSLLGTSQGIMKLRGKWQELTYQTAESGTKTLPTMPIFHPAYLLRQPAQRRLAWLDLIEIKKKIVEQSAIIEQKA